MSFKNPWAANRPVKPQQTPDSDPHAAALERQFKARKHDDNLVSPAMRLDFFEAMRRNQRNTWILIVTMLGLTGFFGYVLGWAWDAGFGGMAQAAMQYHAGGEIDWLRLITTPSHTGFTIGAAMLAAMAVWVVMTLWRADRMVLNMAGAIDAPASMAQLHNVVEEMALAAGLPKPRVVVIPTKVPNAFATGLNQDRAVVGVTEGLMEQMNRRELQAVVAHEVGHILHGDMRYATILAVMVGVLVFVAELALNARRLLFVGRRGNGRGGGHPVFMVIMLVVLVLAAIIVPFLARLIQMAISRQREYLADATAVQLTRDPSAMISALQKIAALQEPSAQMKSALEPLFIIPPVKNMWHKGNMAWFSTHPPLQKRIERLKALE